MPAPPPPPPRRARGPAGPPDATPATGHSAPTPPPRRTPADVAAVGAAASETTARTARAATGTATAATGTAVRGGPTRTERQRAARASAGGSNGGGKRRGVVIGVIVAVIVLGIGAAFALGVFSGGDGGGGGDSASAPEASTNVDLNPGEISVYSAGIGPGALEAGVEEAVMAAIGEYVDKGIVPTLRGEKLEPANLGGAFDEAAIALISPAKSEDREVLFDEGVPPAIGELVLVADGIEIRALNDADGKSLYVSARFGLDASGSSEEGKAGQFEIRHSGELLLAPDISGTWKITAWDMSVERAGAGFPTPLTTSTTTGTTETTDTTTETP